ncbi:MAG: hypothetical protein M0D55_06685 [Elusimicrobiota bacterium]|nr:MAG: hypothetical protein M0D55_06685 [Elusimicrobiota bacterium]
MDNAALETLVGRYKDDPESVYNTWFASGEERLKAFRAIRRGVKDAVDAIAAGTFGNDFRGSPLETVLAAITEQKEVFEGAAHPFYWKPKLRIPDIYENEANKRTFGAFLSACLAATREEQVLSEMSRLAEARIKGLGPSVANIAYFLHPTIVPPFNTAMVKGFNALFGDKKKLGSWESYLAMRETIVQANGAARMSKDLGAFAGLLYEIGTGRLACGDGSGALHEASAAAAKKAKSRHDKALAGQRDASEHTKIQHLLVKIGRALKYDVHVARNDRNRSHDGQSFALLTIPGLPDMELSPEIADTVSLIDVLWLKPGTNEIACAFEVEKSTAIYSGMLRLEDLARSIPGCACHFYLVAPRAREHEVRAQLARPSFKSLIADITLAYIPFDELCEHCDALCKFGDDREALKKIARV